MKILLLHDYGTATGGAELQMLSLRQGLMERGHQVCLFTSRALPVAGYAQLADDTCFGTNSTLQVITQTANFSAYWQLRRVLREFRPDVVHIRMFLWQLSPLILPLLRDIPCIYQTAVYKAICPAGTNLLPDGSSCRFSPGQVCLSSGCLTPKTWLVLMVQWQLWQRWRCAIDRVVALSHGMKTELEQAGLPSVEVIHNGVPVRLGGFGGKGNSWFDTGICDRNPKNPPRPPTDCRSRHIRKPAARPVSSVRCCQQHYLAGSPPTSRDGASV